MRLTADPNPTPLERMSVSKISEGYTAVRMSL
mgnify:FL=1